MVIVSFVNHITYKEYSWMKKKGIGVLEKQEIIVCCITMNLILNPIK